MSMPPPLYFFFGFSGQRIRYNIDSFQNADFFISQPNPMMLPLIGIVSERRFQWGHIIGCGWEMWKLSWKPFCSLFLNCSPEATLHISGDYKFAWPSGWQRYLTCTCTTTYNVLTDSMTLHIYNYDAHCHFIETDIKVTWV